MHNRNNLKIIFFGTDTLAEIFLEELIKINLIPFLVVTKPDAKIGRKQILTPPNIKLLAQKYNIKVYQPNTLKNLEKEDILFQDYDLAILASYGKIVPEEILNIPKYGFLNLHPSYLPSYRGPSPIQAQLLNQEKDLGISIIKLDKEMDHGDILIQDKILIEENEMTPDLEIKAAKIGAKLLDKVIDDYINNKVILKQQNHFAATFCKMVKKEDGEIKLNDDLNIIKSKWRAYFPWPGIFFFITNKNNQKIRIKINSFDLKQNNLKDCIKSVTPEGKKEISFELFLKNYNINL